MKETDILQQATTSTDDVIASMIPTGGLSQLTDVEKIANNLISSLPRINRNAWRVEMENMIVPVMENPTTFDINKGLALAQGYKDRLSEMLLYSQREYKVRKKCLDMLIDAVNLISKATSADKRKGEATLRYPIMVVQVESAEIFMKEIEFIYSNIKSTTDSISRQASVMSMQVQLGERRQGNPRAIDVVPRSNAEEITSKSNKELDWDNF